MPVLAFISPRSASSGQRSAHPRTWFGGGDEETGLPQPLTLSSIELAPGTAAAAAGVAMNAGSSKSGSAMAPFHGGSVVTTVNIRASSHVPPPVRSVSATSGAPFDPSSTPLISVQSTAATPTTDVDAYLKLRPHPVEKRSKKRRWPAQITVGLNPWTLAFEDEEDERNYLKYALVKQIRRWRRGVVVVAGLASALYIYSILKTPGDVARFSAITAMRMISTSQLDEACPSGYFCSSCFPTACATSYSQLADALFLVFTILLPASIALIASRKVPPLRFARWIHAVSAALMIIGAGGGMTIRYFIVEPTAQIYVSAMLHSVFIFTFFLSLRVRFVYAVGTCAFILVLFVALNGWAAVRAHGPAAASLDPRAAFTDNYFPLLVSTVLLLATGVTVTVTAYEHELVERTQFAAQREVERANTKLNHQLRAIQRTEGMHGGDAAGDAALGGAGGALLREFDSPLERSVDLLRSARCEPGLPMSVTVRINQALALLASPNLFVPDVEKDLSDRGARLDDQQEAWLFSEIARRKTADSALPMAVGSASAVAAAAAAATVAGGSGSIGGHGAATVTAANAAASSRSRIISNRRRASHIAGSTGTTATHPASVHGAGSSISGTAASSLASTAFFPPPPALPSPTPSEMSAGAASISIVPPASNSLSLEPVITMSMQRRMSLPVPHGRRQSLGLPHGGASGGALPLVIGSTADGLNDSEDDTHPTGSIGSAAMAAISTAMAPTRASTTTGSGRMTAAARSSGTITNIAGRSIPDLASTVLEWYAARLNEYNFPMFAYADATANRPLSTLMFQLASRHGLFEALGLPMDRFWAFSSAIEAGYHDDLPYHNRVHAADVLHTISCFVQLPEVSRVVSDLDLLSILVAAAIHDYDHPGFNNPFLINTQDPRAILYNDKAILENHHLASSFALLRKPELNFAAGLSKVDFKAFRELVIEMVLATDLSQHLPIISIFKNRVIQGNMDPDASREDRVLLFKMMMKCSDVSNPTKEWSLYEVWYKRILDEFFRQGDIERRLGLDVSPFMDRDKVNIPSCQLGFVDFVVMPLYTAFNLFAPVPAIMQSLANNRDVWSERVKFGQSTTNLPAPPTVPTATAASAAAIHTSGPIHASLHSMPRGSTLSPAVSCKSPSASQGASGQVGSNDSG